MAVKTAGDLIRKCFIISGVRDQSSELVEEDIVNGIDLLNELMARMDADGLFLGWKDVESASEDVYILTKHMRAIKYILAVDICLEYKVTPSQLLATYAVDGYTAIHRDALTSAPNLSDLSQLPASEGSLGAFDVRNG